MEKKASEGKFDAAIRKLGSRSRSCCVECDSIVAAIRVLEAAGVLTSDDREWLRTMVDIKISEYHPIAAGMICPGRARKDRFRALLAALPEPPEGGKG
jgi:hypothetical protein